MARRGAGDQRRRADLASTKCHLGSWARVPEEGDRFLTYRELAERLVPYVQRHRLHPYRAPADHGISVRRLLGLPAGVAVRADEPLRHARRTSPTSSRPPTRPASASARLGAGAFPQRPARARQFRRHASLRARRPSPGLPPGLGHLHLQFRPRRRSPTSWSPTPGSGWSATISTACASMRSRRCSISTTRASRASGCPTSYGGNENLEAIDFLRRMNETAYRRAPGAITVAEESTAWPGVSHPDLHGRPRLRLQVEHGVDARHAPLHVARTRSTGATIITT